MKGLKFLAVLFVFISACAVFSQPKKDSVKTNYFDSTYNSKTMDSLMKVYSKQMDDYNKQNKRNNRGPGSSLFGVNVDVIFGVGISNTSFELNRDTAGLSNTSSKTGPSLGVNVNLRLAGFLLSTGFNYSSKGFTSSNSNTYSANYFNIPLMFSFNFNISKIEVDLSAGPYLGILLSQDQSQYYKMKNIDIGVAGSLQGNYFFNNYVGMLLGVKYEQGGLNNLLQTEGANNYVSSIKTQNWFIYTGVKFAL